LVLSEIQSEGKFQYTLVVTTTTTTAAAAAAATEHFNV
jgi:hypothetical protein